MGSSTGPNVITDSLVFDVDVMNRKSYLNSANSQASLIDTYPWAAGTTAPAQWPFNQSVAGENNLIQDVDPFGNTNLVWGTYASGDGGADGGWNGSVVYIDKTKLYRFSHWVRRTSSTTGGTFYFGTGASPSYIVRLDNSTTEGNPYWECRSPGDFTQNQWYLVVGHVFPYSTTTTAQHPNSGYYTRASGATKVMTITGCNVGGDMKWNSDTTITWQRSYHYYCTDNTTRLQFYDPRIDLCDGTEPTISELLEGGYNVLKDRVSTIYGNVIGKPTFSADRKYLTLNGSSTYVNMGSINTQRDFTLDIWAYVSADSSGLFGQGVAGASQGMHIMWNQAGNRGMIFGMYANDMDSPGYTITLNTWNNFTFTYTHSGAYTKQFYANGVLQNSAAGSAWNGSGNLIIGGAYSYPYNIMNGRLGRAKMYSRVLTSGEVFQNFSAMRGRYGI